MIFTLITACIFCGFLGHSIGNAKVKKLKEVIRLNHKWHQDYDDYGGYPDSWLCNENINGLKL